MDTVGSISDCRIKIKPSESFLDFIRDLKVTELTQNLHLIKTTLLTDNLDYTIVQPEFSESAKLSTDDIEILKNTTQISTLNNTEEVSRNFKMSPRITFHENEFTKENDFMLTLDDLNWVFNYLIKHNISSSKNIYLHELLSDSILVLPPNDILKRNPILEERCKKLRAQQQARDYRDMTRNVDSQRKHEPQESIAYQISQLNRQMIAILQFIFSVAAGFVFGFIGLELMFGELDFGFRLLMGIMFSLIIAIAEIYFLAKKLNEEEVIIKVPINANTDDIPEEHPDEKKLVDDVKNPPTKKDKFNKKHD